MFRAEAGPCPGLLGGVGLALRGVRERSARTAGACELAEGSISISMSLSDILQKQRQKKTKLEQKWFEPTCSTNDNDIMVVVQSH